MDGAHTRRAPARYLIFNMPPRLEDAASWAVELLLCGRRMIAGVVALIVGGSARGEVGWQVWEEARQGGQVRLLHRRRTRAGSIRDRCRPPQRRVERDGDADGRMPCVPCTRRRRRDRLVVESCRPAAAFTSPASLGSGDFVSGYAVARFARCDGLAVIVREGGAYDGEQAYHDQLGVWRGVTREWGAARAGVYRPVRARDRPIGGGDIARSSLPCRFARLRSCSVQRGWYEGGDRFGCGKTGWYQARDLTMRAGRDTIRVELEIEVRGDRHRNPPSSEAMHKKGHCLSNRIHSDERCGTDQRPCCRRRPTG